jgi:hypothetical protein
MRWLDGLRRRLRLLDSLDARLQRVQEALGRIESRQLAQLDAADARRNEFQVYSQWGEDGIIQWLLRHVAVEHRVFVEFGVEDYRESNTRFLLVNDNWSGLVIDSSESHMAALRQALRDDQLVDVLPGDECRQRFQVVAPVDRVAAQRVGLLSIDVDGNDYWIWREIDAIAPELVVVEYNARFGPRRAVTIPYDPDFRRAQAHHSRIYYGASLAALAKLGQRKGYALVGCNSAGNNAFFVRRDRLPAAIAERTPEAAFVPAGFRESRDAEGRLAFLSPAEEQQLLEGLPLVEVDGT